jgi:hypothetical protein
MSWERILKSSVEPIYLPRRPFEVLRENFGEPIDDEKSDDRQFMSDLIMGIGMTLALADYYGIPHDFDRKEPQNVFVGYDLIVDGPLVGQEDIFMIDERLMDVYYKMTRENDKGFAQRNRQMRMFRGLENKDWDEFMGE